MERPARSRPPEERLCLRPVRKRSWLHLSARRPDRLALHAQAFRRVVPGEDSESDDLSLRFPLRHRQPPRLDASAQSRGESYRGDLVDRRDEASRKSPENRRLLGGLPAHGYRTPWRQTRCPFAIARSRPAAPAAPESPAYTAQL